MRNTGSKSKSLLWERSEKEGCKIKNIERGKKVKENRWSNLLNVASPRLFK